MPRRTKEEAEQTRQLLLQTALTLFAKRGITQTSLKDIAAASGLTHGALYWHFKNRTDLVAALYQESRLPLDELFIDQLQAAKQDALGSLGELLKRWSWLVLEDQRCEAIWRVFHLNAKQEPELAAISDHIYAEQQEWLERLAKIYKKARKQGQLPESSKLKQGALAESALAVVFGITASVIYTEGRTPPKQQIKTVLKAYLAGLPG